MKALGYRYRSKVIWEKVTKNDLPVNGNGWVTRHSTETLFIFSKGNVGKITRYHKCRDLVRAPVTKASEKPEEVVKQVVSLVPRQHYLEVYARYNNRRPNFVSVGNQLKAPYIKDEKV
jgi:N6-adenosine-specific RNA methylase IME4